MRFTFGTAPTVLFGPGVAAEIPARAEALGTRACVVTGANPSRFGSIIDGLNRRGLDPVVLTMRGEPKAAEAVQAAEVARAENCDLVVSVGGGGALDAGKAVAALLTNHRPVADYLEVVGPGQPLDFPPAPHLAAPTTAGTGAEVTANAVLSVPEKRVKVSLRSPRLFPTVAVVDPELTLGLPGALTAATGLDALTQLLEAFVSRQANPLTDALCRDGLARAARSLRRAFHDGANLAARTDMCLAALFSGMALANAKLGAVHGLAAPLGGRLGAPHGAVCAALLPHVMEANVRALSDRAPGSAALGAFDEAARILTGDPRAGADAGAAWIAALCAELSLPGLGALGLTRELFPEVAAAAARSSSMKGNPVELTAEELADVLERAL